jgi:hypothetical protein
MFRPDSNTYPFGSVMPAAFDRQAAVRAGEAQS